MIKFRHRNCDKAFTPATFAYILPTCEELEQAETSIHNLEIEFGMAVLFLGNSRENADQYCRKRGRFHAEVNMCPRKFFLVGSTSMFRDKGQRTLYEFQGKVRDKKVQLFISADFQNKIVRMENIDFI